MPGFSQDWISGHAVNLWKNELDNTVADKSLATYTLAKAAVIK